MQKWFSVGSQSKQHVATFGLAQLICNLHEMIYLRSVLLKIARAMVLVCFWTQVMPAFTASVITDGLEPPAASNCLRLAKSPVKNFTQMCQWCVYTVAHASTTLTV